MKKRMHTVHVYCPTCPQMFHVFVYGKDPAHKKGSEARSELNLRILREHAQDHNITPCENPHALLEWISRAEASREASHELKRGRSKEGY